VHIHLTTRNVVYVGFQAVIFHCSRIGSGIGPVKAAIQTKVPSRTRPRQRDSETHLSPEHLLVTNATAGRPCEPWKERATALMLTSEKTSILLRDSRDTTLTCLEDHEKSMSSCITTFFRSTVMRLLTRYTLHIGMK
jgi:hypothetical protein